ncbi:MAG: HEPN domain-containing protein [Dehalococcoidales bacterium]|nr:HEPN domain-containing protein [Dehalococcoidales bacterium]
MSLEDLLRDRKIEKVVTSDKLAKDTLRLAKRDMASAGRNYEAKDYDWCLAIAYNAMLQSGKALMLSKGYRAAGQYKHVAVVEFTRDVFGTEITERLIEIFNRLRKKRHRVVYEDVGTVSEEEAKRAIGWADEFVRKTEKIISMQSGF